MAEKVSRAPIRSFIHFFRPTLRSLLMLIGLITPRDAVILWVGVSCPCGCSPNGHCESRNEPGDYEMMLMPATC